ncbi:MAG: hypothetical protein KKD33_06450, partial [Verrucomicrobia bacterium]|nr:hypothetical protein [Verrucomicrobiota bacterium]
MKTKTVRPQLLDFPACGSSARAVIVSLIFGCILALNVYTASAQSEKKTVVLGITSGEADKHNVEFRRYDRMMPVYRRHGIEPSLISIEPFVSWDWSEDQIYQLLKPFHAVLLITIPYAVSDLTPALDARGKIVGAALARYVNEGGGLFVQAQSWGTSAGEKYWNIVLAPFGIEVLHEGCCDTTRTYKGAGFGSIDYWFTKNIKPHPVTVGVERLYLPTHGYAPFPGVPAIRYSPDWEVVVAGEAEAKSFRRDAADTAFESLNLDQSGSYASAPPVAAVRSFGKGRVVSFPLCPIHSGMNYSNPAWKNIVESAGDRSADLPSFGMTLLMNCYRWIAEPAQTIAGFGAHVDPPYQAVKYLDKVDLDVLRFNEPEGGVKGYAYPDGQKPDFSPAGDGIRGIVG